MTNKPAVRSTSGLVPKPVNSTANKVTKDCADTTTRLRRGTSPATLPRSNRAGNAPSRPSAAPRVAAPAQEAVGSGSIAAWSLGS
ncbi:hypothetical protein GTW78_16940 [Streptomyces sp. SID4948]|nr:hypothetical protein [Streptomyces sp. SID4948]